MDGDWAYLPRDLLIDIAKRFESVEDMAVFSSVCSSWNAVSSIVKATWVPSFPWLMLTDKLSDLVSFFDHSPCKWAAHNPSTNKSYNMVLPETHDQCCWGCSDGWIFTLDLDMECELFNPITKARISLPPAHTFPMLEDFDFNNDDHKELFRRGSIQSVSMIQIPPDNELRVFVTYNKFYLAFARPEDFAWNALACYDELYPGVGNFSNIEYMVGFNGEILIIYEDGKLSTLGKLDGFVADQFAKPDVITKNEVDSIANVYVRGELGGAVSIFTTEGDDTLGKRLYLLELFGDLLVVVKYMKYGWGTDNDLEELVTWWFEVFKLDSKAGKWVTLKDLGDVALFLGDRCTPMAVRASSAGYCKPNCIYFIEVKDCPIDFKEYALGVFDLSSGVMEEIYLGDSSLYYSRSPFWLMPKLV